MRHYGKHIIELEWLPNKNLQQMRRAQSQRHILHEPTSNFDKWILKLMVCKECVLSKFQTWLFCVSMILHFSGVTPKTVLKYSTKEDVKSPRIWSNLRGIMEDWGTSEDAWFRSWSLLVIPGWYEIESHPIGNLNRKIKSNDHYSSRWYTQKMYHNIDR